ncbi:amidohydrolase family protein [Simiduia sp. 21SJ11W-1]|uniref:amidohydrolase family protein n=1 Tax=Simiduia sp. 21SJ11W-1 TaxID=2909669 RepID=UPI0020A221ED|nr:amidohydrolase family protein [Simiduia sp. 21SJ11W-1]UTA48522.1 amidohydrolase family protein [Simiduia sp. 21SJ11W-1]
MKPLTQRLTQPVARTAKFWLGAFSLALATAAGAESILIKGADVYTATDLKPATDVYINNGRIEALGKNLTQSADRTLDGKGKTITAGLFNSSTHLGVVEVGAIEQTVDFYTERADITAALKVADAFNPNSTLLPHNRAHGLTHALVMPEAGAGLFAGQVALVQLGVAPRVVHESLGVAVDFTEHGVELAGKSRAAAMALLRQGLEDAKDYSANRRAALAGERREYSISLMDAQALAPVVNGEKPLFVRVHRASDIRGILALAKTYKLKLILAGVEEGWMVAEDIAQAQVPVIVDPINNLPSGYEALGARLDNVVTLHKAGITLLFTGMSWHNTHNAYLVRQSAGNAVANGLDKHAAIAAMTLNPARVFKAPVAGDLVQGAVADLVLWDGDPLEVTTEPALVMAAGEVVPMVTRATMLRDRYFERLSAK